MKVGDKHPVTIAGQVVAEAEVKELEGETVTLVVPATRVVMAVQTQLAEAPQVAPETQTIVIGTEGPDGNTDVAQAPAVEATPPAAQPVEAQPVVSTQPAPAATQEEVVDTPPAPVVQPVQEPAPVPVETAPAIGDTEEF